MRTYVEGCVCAERLDELVIARGRGGDDFVAGSVGELDGDLLPLGVHECRDLGEGWDVLVGPQAEVLWCDSAFWRDGSRLEEGQAGSARGDPTNFTA